MKTITSLSLVIIALSFSSCVKDLASNTVGLSNETDDFSLGVTLMDEYNHNETFVYECTGDTSDLSIGGTLHGGILKIRVADEQGNILYDKSHTSISGTSQLLIAPAGKWTIKVDCINLNGTMGISLSKEK